MATGLNSFIHCQFGIETTYGTLVPATLVVPGLTTGAHELMVTNEYPQTYQGDLAVVHDRVQTGQIGDFDLQGLVGFENLPLFLNMTLREAVATADAGTPTPATTYAYIPTLTAENVPQSYTVEAGDQAHNWAYPGTLGRELRVSAEVDGLTEFAFTGFAKSATLQAKTALSPTLTVETLPANFWELSIDNASGGTLGATPFAGCLRGFSLTMSGYTPFKCIDGTYTLTQYHQLGLDATLELTVTADDTAVALMTNYHRVGTASALIRLEQEGSIVHTAIHKRIRFDGTWFLDTVSKYGGAEADNVNLLTLTWKMRRLGTLALAAEVVNAVPPATISLMAAREGATLEGAAASAPAAAPAAAPPAAAARKAA